MVRKRNGILLITKFLFKNVPFPVRMKHRGALGKFSVNSEATRDSQNHEP